MQHYLYKCVILWFWILAPITLIMINNMRLQLLRKPDHKKPPDFSISAIIMTQYDAKLSFWRFNYNWAGWQFPTTIQFWITSSLNKGDKVAIKREINSPSIFLELLMLVFLYINFLVSSIKTLKENVRVESVFIIDHWESTKFWH